MYFISLDCFKAHKLYFYFRPHTRISSKILQAFRYRPYRDIIAVSVSPTTTADGIRSPRERLSSSYNGTRENID